jgi:hypothetical protein
MFEKMEEKFGLIPAPEVQIIEAEPVLSNEENQDKLDRELARKTQRDMIEKSSLLLSEISKVAEASEHPRAYEVAANLIKTISDIASKLDESASRTLPKHTPKESSDTHNHLYVGSTEDLVKLIKEKKG